MLRKRFTEAVFAAVAIVSAGTLFANQPFNPPGKETDYKEDFRPQYHFSPKWEWMNDINALIYQDGTYHMLYQWGKAKRHGGYATSKDLIHWEDKGVALVPQKSHVQNMGAKPNVSGDQVYSGSGVLVEGEIAEKITGSPKPALVTHYTGTAVGTCIAWSNDKGATWHNYKNNPVAHPAKGHKPRDPCVFWYEPTKTWILALFENGTTFYGSKDLIKWDQLSNIKFGFECPDLFELPLDGDKSKMKWILQDANGTYLVGQFDGTKFTPDLDLTEGRLVMDKGPDFYAGQTFYPENLPERKIIQIAWNDHWNGGVGEQGWMRNATFPVELGLITYDDKSQVTRTPIPTIRKLYTDTKTFENQTLKPGNNILADIRSKTFDMIAVFDFSNTAAKTIKFTIANKTYTYKIPEQKFVGCRIKTVKKNGKRERSRLQAEHSMKPDADNQLKIRMLIDWSNIEIFANEGVFSYSEHFALDPKASNVEIAVDADVILRSLELNQLKSIW